MNIFWNNTIFKYFFRIFYYFFIVFKNNKKNHPMNIIDYFIYSLALAPIRTFPVISHAWHCIKNPGKSFCGIFSLNNFTSFNWVFYILFIKGKIPQRPPILYFSLNILFCDVEQSMHSLIFYLVYGILSSHFISNYYNKASQVKFQNLNWKSNFLSY